MSISLEDHLEFLVIENHEKTMERINAKDFDEARILIGRQMGITATVEVYEKHAEERIG